MKSLRLRWLDGRDTTHDFQGDPRTTELEIHLPDGSHSFRATDDHDDECLDVFVEEDRRMAGETPCRADLHVWRRDAIERHSPIPDDRLCGCLRIRYSALPNGTKFLTEYRETDGSITPGAQHHKGE